jgi:uncharacterized membrane protein
VRTSSKIFAFLAYLLLIFGWLYIFIFRREDKLALYHAKQAFLLTVIAVGAPLVWAIFGWLISFIPFVGPIVAVALFSLVIATYIFLVATWIVGMVYALQAKPKSLPVVGGWVERLPIN